MRHTLKVFFTASSGVLHFPEVVAVLQLNDVQASYYDSNIKTALPKQDWMAKLRDEDPGYWKWYTRGYTVLHQLHREEFHNLKKRINQTGGIFLIIGFTFTH